MTYITHSDKKYVKCVFVIIFKYNLIHSRLDISILTIINWKQNYICFGICCSVWTFGGFNTLIIMSKYIFCAELIIVQCVLLCSNSFFRTNELTYCISYIVCVAIICYVDRILAITATCPSVWYNKWLYSWCVLILRKYLLFIFVYV